MLGLRAGWRAGVGLLAASLLALGAAGSPAEAAFSSTASVTVPTTSATLQPALAVVLPGGVVCLGTVTVTWTPSLSFVTGQLYGFIPANISYVVTLTSGIFSTSKTVTGGGSATVDFTGLTLLSGYSATVQATYKGWTSTTTASLANRVCVA